VVPHRDSFLTKPPAAIVVSTRTGCWQLLVSKLGEAASGLALQSIVEFCVTVLECRSHCS
jgi:hypothetical protein